jgi:selenocysteine-specific elongation factor
VDGGGGRVTSRPVPADPEALPRQRVVATAGHVDHGKSSLVRALTGTDPDRLAEEQVRGLTIDLGFAFSVVGADPAAPAHQVAFVDVPGHVRFLKNMLAGVGGVDAAVLVVAATEGWMPQSEEHLRILDLLGVEHGMVVISKADLVDDETVELAGLEAADHLAGTVLAGCPVVACDSLSGRGLDDVVRTLSAVLDAAPAAADRGRPRLWIDRVFAARGAGTVVTGTLTGGSIAVDDELIVLPGRRRVRVRGLESGHARLVRARPGCRLAANLVGVDHGELRRGDALVAPGQWHQATVVDVGLTLLAGDPLPRRGRLKAHVGSGELDAVVRLLDDDARFARVHLDRGVPLAPGDRLVLRDPGRRATVGGAVVLDVDPVGRASAAPARLALDLGPRLLAARPWLAVDDLVTLAGTDPVGAERLADQLVAAGAARRVGDHLAAPAALDALVGRARATVVEHHRAHPLEPGVELGGLATRLRADPDHVDAAVAAAADLVVEHGRVRHRDHRVDTAHDPEAQRFLAALAAQPFAPPSAKELGIRVELVRALVREGSIVDLGGGIHFTADAWADARARLVAALAERGSVTVSSARDVLGSSRKYVLEVLAKLDAEGVTRRRGDDRYPGPRSGLPVTQE